MDHSAKKFFKDILETPSPSGYEQPVQDIVRQYVADFADDVRTDLHGNVIACCNADAPLRVMFAGHADQIGLIVSHINENGYIYTNTIGGWDPQQLIGQRMTIYTAERPDAGRHRPQADSPARRGRAQEGREDTRTCGSTSAPRTATRPRRPSRSATR